MEDVTFPAEAFDAAHRGMAIEHFTDPFRVTGEVIGSCVPADASHSRFVPKATACQGPNHPTMTLIGRKKRSCRADRMGC